MHDENHPAHAGAYSTNCGDRGEADQQIAPFRGRLAELRPRRPLTLLRLLCEPFDPLLVPGHRWRRGSPGIPRTALGPLGRVVRAGLADAAAGIDAALAGHSSDEAGADRRRSALRLWPRARPQILAAARTPKDWVAATNLRAEADYTAASDACSIAAALAQAVTSLLRLLLAHAA